ncbi:hypothetical protein QO034_00155 [Sedimentitalea sp. JM2-8]|uniref:DUF4239 domain-containing protein n=1 Tax=Sedimentitalea xiamensis TaxID=3050037 RepID=A0ABT7F8T6_9RHOB|nr:hypothetical protein [Sedimentitalea xiamensis]MDK3071506.1 hypothetical protein [Sedimentitalea xiamensis]
MNVVTRGISTIERLIGTLISSAYLFFLYAVTLWLVVGSLSAIQVRDSYSDRQLPFTFGPEDTATAQDYLFKAKTRISDALYFGEFSDRERRMWVLIDSITSAFPEVIGPNQEFGLSDFVSSFRFRELENACGTTEAKRECSDVRQLRQEFSEFERMKQSGDIPTEAESEAAALKELESLRRFTEFVELNYFFENLNYTVFLNAPREVLVMILTMVMGVLGSVVTMTWSFVRQDTGYSLRRMLLLPFVGGMSAFVILVFLKAGQLTLTAGESNDPLSPFVLSFVGIVSGLLSERAYARMSEVGSNFFAVNEDVPRWGIRLESVLAAQDMQYQDVARYLQTDAVKAKDIIDGNAPATLAEQRLIAACLRADPREIFTDQPPRAGLAGDHPATPG